LILLGNPKWGPIGDLRTIYQGCRALPFALAGLSCFSYKSACINIFSQVETLRSQWIALK